MTTSNLAPAALEPIIKSLREVLSSEEQLPPPAWQLKLIRSADCLSYVVWNTDTKEAVLIDPKQEDIGTYTQIQKELSNHRWLAVIDTHTHADHISAAAQMAEALNAPLVMHHQSPSSRIHIRICRNTQISSQAGDIRLVMTPGHTGDGITPLWGPFAFTGDTVLYGDVGRDDLPGGNPAAHFQSLEDLKAVLHSQTLICPGHDNRGGRISSWATQLKINSSLTQGREDYIQESAAFDAPAPALFKKALVENFK